MFTELNSKLNAREAAGTEYYFVKAYDFLEILVLTGEDNSNKK